MAVTFCLRGSEAVCDALVDRLVASGLSLVSETGAADVIVAYCASSNEHEDVFFDDSGIVQMANPGSLIVDLSPSTASVAREIMAVASVNDLLYVEAPLVAFDAVCADPFGRENLRCFYAGDDDAKEKALSVLEVLAAVTIDAGDAGAAQIARAACTLQKAALIVSAVEALSLARAARKAIPGLSVKLHELGAITPEALGIANAIEEGRFESEYTIEIMMCEIVAALATADDCDLIIPQAEAGLHLAELLMIIGGSEKGVAALSLVYATEEECAEQGLDWSLAETAFNTAGERHECGCGDDCHCHDHDLDDYDEDDWMDEFDYSSN